MKKIYLITLLNIKSRKLKELDGKAPSVPF